ncbi:MAG: patatin [Bradyrhizobium sp.]|nr:MAG: patatin [Bradyrhizobium sp.]
MTSPPGTGQWKSSNRPSGDKEDCMSDPQPSQVSARDRHLFAPGPKRILALDGGGVRGVVALAFLKQIEQELAAKAGHPVRLCDHFDLIGGTSTGAIIAVALALGYRVDAITEFYHRLAPLVFRSPMIRLPGWKAIFDATALARELETVMGDRRLDTEDLQTGVGVILKRLDTGSAWVLVNNPRSKYWETPANQDYIGNRHYRLAQIVRASTAAPHYFDPQEIAIAEGVQGLFVDGGLTPHNNPALALFLAAYIPTTGLGWGTGPDKLTIVSVGAGTFRDSFKTQMLSGAASARLALRAMIQQIGDSQQLVLTLMSLFGESPTPWAINAELGELGSTPAPGGPLFRFLRYDIKLDQAWLQERLGAKVSEQQVGQMRRLDDVRSMQKLGELAAEAARRQVKTEDWGG